MNNTSLTVQYLRLLCLWYTYEKLNVNLHNGVTFKYPILPVRCIHILPTEESWYKKMQNMSEYIRIYFTYNLNKKLYTHGSRLWNYLKLIFIYKGYGHLTYISYEF